jgi:hypothetical protein
MNILRGFSAVALAITVLASAFGQTPEAARDDALNKLKVAQELMISANGLVSGTPSESDLRTAMKLYAQAGQGFQDAGYMLAKLGSQYVSQQDVDGCLQSSQNCLTMINKIKATLAK